MSREGRFISNDGVDARSLSFGRGVSVSFGSWNLQRYRMLMLFYASRFTTILAAATALRIILGHLNMKPRKALLA